MGSRRVTGMLLGGFLVLWPLLSVQGGEWEDYLKSPYEDFRWNWLLRDGHLAYGQGKYKEALGIYQEAMKKGCQDPLMQFRMGYSYRALRMSDEAAKYFAASKKGLAEAYPKHRYNWFSRYYLAELFFQTGVAKAAKEKKAAAEYYQKAVNELEEAVKQNPKFGQAFLLYGNICYRQGKYELASEKYQRAYEINPKSVEALVNLGASHLATGKCEPALRAYLKAKTLSAGDVRISLSVAGIYSEMKKPREALTEYENALRTRPGLEKALVGAGNAAWQIGENEKAMEYYQRALAKNLRSYEALLGLGLVMLKKERLEEAEENFKKCLEVKPDSKEAHYNLGVLYDSRGDFDNAIKAYVRVIEIDPDDESCYYNVGLAFIKAGLYDEAKSHLEQAVERFGKESKWSKVNLKLLELIDKIEKRGKGKETEVEKELEKAMKAGKATGGE